MQNSSTFHVGKELLRRYLDTYELVVLVTHPPMIMPMFDAGFQHKLERSELKPPLPIYKSGVHWFDLASREFFTFGQLYIPPPSG